MKISKLCVVVLTLVTIWVAKVNGQSSPIVSLGSIKQADIKGQQVSIQTENGFGEISVYAPNIIRVRLDKRPLGKDISFAVIAKPQQVKVSIVQTGTEIKITTDSLEMRVNKSPFTVAVYTPDGKLINEDEKGLQTSWAGEEVTSYKKMQDGERFIGLGEKTGNLDRAGSGYTNWNSDTYGYHTDQDPIYSTIPFYIGIHHQLNYGIFLDNTFQSDFNFGASNNRFSSFGARGGEMNYYVVYNKRLADIITSYTWLTGRMTMPPLWTLGYQQNRYSYYPEAEVMRIAQTLREKQIPADGITLDIHYMDAYKLFTWNKSRFPHPKGMTDRLKKMGIHTTVIVDPGIKVEKGYGAYERGMKEDVFLKYADGQPYTGQVWPGWVHFPDFTGEKGRTWWRNEIKTFANDGVSGLWNDMNEISTWGQKMPNNILYNYDGKITTNQEGRNVFGMQMARSSYEGMRAASNKRPFILTRSGYAGLQRYTAIWTGDNRSEDDHMLLGVRLMNSLGVSGVPFTGMDIGGFTGGASTALFARWMQIGAFIPYYRNHTAINTRSAEPWAYGEEVLEICRNYISLRYKLLPYLYSTFYEATQNGLPVMRTMAIDYTHDPRVYDPRFQNQYFFGKSILVAPFESNKAVAKVYFPKGMWYDIYTGNMETGDQDKFVPLSLNKLPVYVKESSIIPMQSLVQTTMQKPTDTLVVNVYKGSVNNSFVYYEDDGETYDYEKGNFYKRTISYEPNFKTISFGKSEGTFQSNFKKIKLVFHGFGSIKSVKIDGQATSVKDEFLSLLTPVSKFDPQGQSNQAEGYHVKTVTIDSNNRVLKVNYN
jgi:alpha-glucosidase